VGQRREGKLSTGGARRGQDGGSIEQMGQGGRRGYRGDKEETGMVSWRDLQVSKGDAEGAWNLGSKQEIEI
jgi:hypothetical protein